jgi:hypothetical protein
VFKNTSAFKIGALKIYFKMLLTHSAAILPGILDAQYCSPTTLSHLISFHLRNIFVPG